VSALEDLRNKYGPVGFAWWKFWIGISEWTWNQKRIPKKTRMAAVNKLGEIASMARHVQKGNGA
jgi:hypothetical protein